MFWLLLTRAATVSRLSPFVSGGVKRVVTDALISSAAIYAVDEITDAFDGSDDDSLTEGMIDIILGLVLASRGRVAFGRASSAGGNLRRDSLAKYAEVKALLKTIPVISPTFLEKVIKAAPRAMQWVRDAKTKTLSAYDSKTGALLATLDPKGWRLPNGIKLSGLTMSKGNALGATGLFTAGATIPYFILDALEVQVEAMTVVARDEGDTMNRSRLPKDNEEAKLAFIRDPDMWLDEFGGRESSTSERIDHAINWLLSSSQRTVMEWPENEVSISSTEAHDDGTVSISIKTPLGDVDQTVNSDDSRGLATRGFLSDADRVGIRKVVRESEANAAAERAYSEGQVSRNGNEMF